MHRAAYILQRGEQVSAFSDTINHQCVHASLSLSGMFRGARGKAMLSHTQQTKRARVRLVRLCTSLSPWEDQEMPIHAPVNRAC